MKIIVIIDNSLERYKNIVSFPEKLAKVNAALKRIGLPTKNNKIIKTKF